MPIEKVTLAALVTNTEIDVSHLPQLHRLNASRESHKRLRILDDFSAIFCSSRRHRRASP